MDPSPPPPPPPAAADGTPRVVAEAATTAPDGAVTVTRVATATRPPPPPPQVIGIVGFGNFGQFLAATFVKQGHKVIGMSRGDYSAAATELGASYTRDAAVLVAAKPQVVIFCTSIMSLAMVLKAFPLAALADTLVVDVLSVKVHAAALLTELLPAAADILCTHPMFGPESGRAGWGGLPFVYDRLRVRDGPRCDRFLAVWAAEGCRMVEMSVSTHDAYAASTQFITHTTGRLLAGLGVGGTPINTKGYESLLGVVDTTIKDSFDLYYGLYKYNPMARAQLDRLEASFAAIRSRLDACEAAEADVAAQGAAAAKHDAAPPVADAPPPPASACNGGTAADAAAAAATTATTADTPAEGAPKETVGAAV